MFNHPGECNADCLQNRCLFFMHFSGERVASMQDVHNMYMQWEGDEKAPCALHSPAATREKLSTCYAGYHAFFESLR